MSDTQETPEGDKIAHDSAAVSKRDIDKLSKVDQIFLRISVLNTILAVAGVFTGAIALYAAITEADAVRRQSAATVWPFVQFELSNYIDDEGPYFAVILKNAGVGPAKISTLRFIVNGEARKNWQEVVEVLVPDTDISFGNSYARNRVLRPGEELILIQSTDALLYEPFLAAANDSKNSLAYCYCSIFDECWLVDSRNNLQQPRQVESCPKFGDEEFQN